MWATTRRRCGSAPAATAIDRLQTGRELLKIGASLVADLNSGYFDRLLMTPVSRLALLIGTMCADFVLVALMTIPVLCLGFVVGVSFPNGVLGLLAFVGISAFWGMVFPGFTYAIAFKTASPPAVASATLFFPFAFLTTTFLAEDQLTG